MGRVGVPKITLRFNGLFDFDGFYVAVSDWAKNYGYMWHESDYKHKVPSPAGAEQELKWRLTKNVTDYIAFNIVLEVHTWDQRDVDVDIGGGKKRQLTNARINVEFNGTIDYDWQKRYSGSKFSQFLGKWYEKLVRPVETIYWDQLYYRMWNLHALAKKYFDMQSKQYAYKGYLGED